MNELKPNQIDPERLAALIDGRLSADERAALLAQVALDEGAQALLADAATVTRELERPTIPDVPVRTPARRSWLRPGWMALAAGIVAVVALQVARPKGDAVQQYVERIDPRATGAPTFELSPWSTTRSVGSEAVSVDALPWRLGARLVDVEVAAAAGNDSAAAALGAQVVALLEERPGINAATRDVYADRASLGAAGASDRADARKRIRAAIPEIGLDLGQWVEAARYAAKGKRLAFFALPQSSASLQRLQELGTLTPRAADLMEAAARGRALDDPDWEEVSIALTRVLAVR